MLEKSALLNILRETVNSYIRNLPPDKKLKLLAASYEAKKSARLGRKIAIVADLIKNGKVNLEQVLDEIIAKAKTNENNS